MRFSKDERGVASIEFLLIVPLMLALMFGGVQVTAAYAVYRKVAVVSRTMSDLVSQEVKVCTTDLNNALAVGKAIMWPYPSEMSATISQVKIDPKTLQGKIDWSSNEKTRAVGSAVTVPQDIAVGGTYLIMSEVDYYFTPAIGFNIANNFQAPQIHFSKQGFTSPRQTSFVQYDTSKSCS
ncbi:TadE/TadG family type IV pilus assembly protein [Bradyrhizobium sp. SYSU BS000235]|uniref:TadE/TadG family type IV pilus assembly protein n=1 Tax=Bradyrhizobium sp. SYSU BS000235 TaxID=3411332 RepID=UPI003C77B7A5